MKTIFLAYSPLFAGNVNTALFAARIKEDLERLNYVVLFNEANYHAEVAESEAILFLITADSVSEESNYRNILSYGDRIGKKVMPVRIYNASVPISITDLSYIDFLDGHSLSGELDETKYKTLIKAIDKGIKNYKVYKEAQDKKLKENLLRSTYEPRFKDFAFQSLLFEKCLTWILNPEKKSGLGFLLGGPGSGKTTFLSTLAQKTQIIKAMHFANEADSLSRKVKSVLLNWAYYLALQDGHYRKMIQGLAIERIEEKTEASIFEELFIVPLQKIEKYLCLFVDGLDEMEVGEAQKLMALLKVNIGKFPKNISFLIAAREGASMLGSTREYETFLLTNENNKAAAQDYIDYMAKKNQISLSEVQKILLLELSEGNFKYLSYWFKEERSKVITDEEVLAFPSKLCEFWQEIMAKKFATPEDMEFYSDIVHPILSVLLASQNPVSNVDIQMKTRLNSDDLNDFKIKMETLIYVVDGMFSFYHKSLRTFFMNREEAGRFLIE